MNPFQSYCKERIEDALGRHGIAAQFDRLPGDPERTGDVPDRSGHYRAEVRHGERNVEVYLYTDEAGFKTDRGWFVFERQRYDDRSGLVTALTRELEGWLLG